MKVLRSGEVDVVLFNHLRTDSPLYSVARTMPCMLSRDYFTKVEQHWCMTVPNDLKQFLAACSHNRRRNFKRWTKKLESRYPGQMKMVTYSKQDEVAEGLRIAAHISANTYQRAYGGGLIYDAATRALFEAAAKKGWLRIHILFVADEPCAFWTALKYGRTYFAEFTSYCPKWGDLHVGSILFLKVVEQICGDSMLDSFDFGFGDGQHKWAGSNRQWPEASVFIFAPRPYPVLVNLIRSSTLATSTFIQRVITGMGIRNLVQRYRRRRIVRKNTQAEYDLSLD
jgi:CelD/BcsL family acetyltransferase involved in cellulose biosynthesis